MSDLRVIQSPQVAATQAITAAVNFGVGSLVGVGMPADLGGATTMTFQVSADGGTTFKDLYDQYGSEVKLANGAGLSPNVHYAVDAALFLGYQFVKFRFGTSAAPITYANARTVDAFQLNQR